MSPTQTLAQQTAQRCADLMWAGDNASKAMGMELVSVAPGRATLRMKVREDMVNGHGIGHGGLTFSLADSAFAFACNTYNRRTVAQSCEITFLAPTHLGQVLTAEAVERDREGRDGTYDVTVTNGTGVVARFVGHSKEIRGTFFDDEAGGPDGREAS
jgi:acyl-CoA thioesterase